MRALIRSENGADHARLLEVTTTADGVSYQVVAERPGYELDEFVVSDDLSTVAMLWNINGASELQILEYADNTLARPDSVARHGGQRTVDQRGRVDGGDDGRGPVACRATVELVDPRTREWERIDREPSSGPAVRARRRWRPSPPATGCVHRLAVPATPPACESIGRDDVSARRPGRPGQAGLQRVLPAAAGGRHHGVPSECARLGRIRPLVHARRRQGAAVRGDRRRRRRGTVSGRPRSGARRPHRLLRLVIRRIPDPGGAHVSSAAVRRGHQHLRDERPEHLVPQHRAVDRGGGLLRSTATRSATENCSTSCRLCSARTR